MRDEAIKPGFVLVELLRRRRELQIGEVIELLASLPEQLDTSLALRDASLLRDIRVELEKPFKSHEVSRLMDSPIAGWPKFALSIQPFSVETVAADETGVTKDEATLRKSPAAVMASLVYELLGGRQRPGMANRLPPIAALGERANDVLRRAITSDQYRDARTFWRDFVTACRGHTPPRELRLRTPLAQLQPGLVCQLTPLANDATPIYLVARSSFRIGRSAHKADFLTRFLPKTPENDERSSELSRGHVLLECVDGKITLRDGDGTTPSRNGSRFENVPLSAERGTAITSGGILSLGSHYRMNLILMPAPNSGRIAGTDGLDEPNQRAPAGAGAVTFEPLDGQWTIVEAAWLLDGAGFSLDSAGHFRWHVNEVEAAPTFFLRRRGAFLLANGSDARIEADGGSLAPGEVVALRSGQSLRLGDCDFAVAVS